MPISVPKAQDIQVIGRVTAEFAQILTPQALDFVAKLHRAFESRRQELLARRAARQKEFDAGKLPDFLPETRQVRENDWKIAAMALAHGYTVITRNEAHFAEIQPAARYENWCK